MSKTFYERYRIKERDEILKDYPLKYHAGIMIGWFDALRLINEEQRNK